MMLTTQTSTQTLTISLTRMEREFLEACHTNEFASIFDYDGEESTWVWAAVDSCPTITQEQARGVMVSLQTKGLIILNREARPDESTICSTNLGVAWAQENLDEVED